MTDPKSVGSRFMGPEDEGELRDGCRTRRGETKRCKSVDKFHRIKCRRTLLGVLCVRRVSNRVNVLFVVTIEVIRFLS